MTDAMFVLVRPWARRARSRRSAADGGQSPRGDHSYPQYGTRPCSSACGVAAKLGPWRTSSTPTSPTPTLSSSPPKSWAFVLPPHAGDLPCQSASLVASRKSPTSSTSIAAYGQPGAPACGTTFSTLCSPSCWRVQIASITDIAGQLRSTGGSTPRRYRGRPHPVRRLGSPRRSCSPRPDGRVRRDGVRRRRHRFRLAGLGHRPYALQIFFDFSGYSDMAIGLARMLGFRLMENFVRPYLAVGFGEFWRRWHISLSTWIRDYLYIPLGGERVSTHSPSIAWPSDGKKSSVGRRSCSSSCIHHRQRRSPSRAIPRRSSRRAPLGLARLRPVRAPAPVARG